MKTSEEIQDLADQTHELILDRSTKCAGMSYLEGVEAALQWVQEDVSRYTPIE
jgi:hypothetical protein